MVGPDGGVGVSGSVDPVTVLPLSSGTAVITLVSLLLGTGVVLASKGAVLV